MSPNVTLYVALGLYALATLCILATLLNRSERLQRLALAFAAVGLVSHTVWIGTICTLTRHPPLTNLPEAAAFIAWTILALDLLLVVRYKVKAAAFVVYPLVLMLLTITAIVREPFAQMDPGLRSGLFTTHLLLTTLGVAGLLIGLAFTLLYHLQERALKSKTPGPLYDWIPSLRICDVVSYRALATGFAVYTLGIFAGILWSYRTTAGELALRTKEIGALVAWLMFAALLQSYINGTYRKQRAVVISAAAFIAILVAILGIHHG